MILLPPANEVCEGNVFTGVCLSTGGVLVSVQEDLCSGGLCPERVSIQGVVSVRETSSCTVKSGWYASYWHAFLLESKYSHLVTKYYILN